MQVQYDELFDRKVIESAKDVLEVEPSLKPTQATEIAQRVLLRAQSVDAYAKSGLEAPRTIAS